MDVSLEFWQWAFIALGILILALSALLFVAAATLGLLAKVGLLGLLAGIATFLGKHFLTDVALKGVIKLFRWVKSFIRRKSP